MKTVYKNIKQLIGAYGSPVGLLEGAAMADARSVDNAFLIVKDGVVEKFGRMDSLSDADVAGAAVEDLSGQFVTVELSQL